MKHNLLILLFSFLILQTFGQNASKRMLLSKKFIDITGIKNILDNKIMQTEKAIFDDIPALFARNNLDASVNEDIQYFKSNIHSQLYFKNRNIYNQIVFKYQNFNYKLLKAYVKLIEENQKVDLIKEIDTAKVLLNNLLRKEIAELNNVFIPQYLDNIRKKRAEIPLTILLNGQKVSAKSINFNILVEIDGFKIKRISLLNKDKSSLKKPNNYQDIISLIIIYQNKEFVFKPKPEIFRLPKKLAELKNPVSAYSFEDIPYWKISIIDKDNRITIHLYNVEEFIETIEKQ